MTLRRITIFLTVAKHLSYTKAAKELYLSQPAITKNIQELEQELGARLFNRRGNSIELTAAGKLVYSHGNDINRLVENLKFELGALSDELAGRLRIGASSTISQYVIPSAIAEFQNKYPQIEVSLISGNTSEVNAHLDGEIIDLGITEGDRKLNNFNYTPFLNDEVVFVTGSPNSFSIAKKMTEEQLREFPLVIRETGSGTREVFEEAMGRMGMKVSDLNILMPLGSTESIKSFLLNASAIGVISVTAIRDEELDLYQWFRVENHSIERTFSFITKQGTGHKLTTAFIRFCKRYYNEQL